MEQKVMKNTRMELQVLSVSNPTDYEHAIQGNRKGLDGVIIVNDSQLGTNCNISMSNEESKIRAELEADIERDLEEELKDDICHLALRLHQLYQHQMDRNGREASRSGNKTRSAFDKKTFSEVNITIKMEAGGSKIEINKIQKVAHENHRPRTSISEGNKHGNIFPGAKKFNWVDTLRSGNSTSVIINRKHEIPHSTVRILKNVHHVKEGRHRNSGKKGKLLELGWRS